MSKKSTIFNSKHSFFTSSKAAKILLLFVREAIPKAWNFYRKVFGSIFWIFPKVKMLTYLSLLRLTLPISGTILVLVKSSFNGFENIFWASGFYFKCFLKRTSFCNFTKAWFISSIKGSICSFWKLIETFPKTPVWRWVYKWLTSSVGILST